MLFLSRAIHTKDSKPVSPLIEDPHVDSGMECMACNRVIILGSRPFEKLTWLMSTTDADDAVVCLLYYFAKLCKTRNPSSQGEYHRLLEFVPLPAKSEGIGVSDPKVGYQLKLLYSKLRERWEWLEKDENARAVVPTGVCLLNIFDIGNSKAAQDFCPILSKYCKRSVHVACYSGTRDAEVLKKELAKENDQHYFQSTKYKLLKQMSGCTHNEQIVTLAAIDMGFINQTTQYEAELAESFQKMLGIEKIHHLGIHPDLIESTKISLEKSVMSASFYEETPLRYMLLLHRIRQECELFWLKRCDIESFSKGYNFENGDLEKFLRLFSSFGDIFYAHDIPSLRGYVVVNIVRFVKHIHSLYNTNHEATKYGLFRWREEENWKVTFAFLTNLGIAVEVKPNKIVPEQELPLDKAMSYYYIPSARVTSVPSPEPLSSASQASLQLELSTATTDLISSNGYTTEILQVLLCKHLLISKSCLLVLTERANTTIIRFCENGSNTEFVDLKFIDAGNKFMMQTRVEKEITKKICQKITSMCPFLTTRTPGIPSKEFSQGNERTEQKSFQVQPKSIFAVAKELSTQSGDILTALASKFGLSQEWVQQLDEEMTEREKIQHMLYEYKETATKEQFTTALQELGHRKNN